MAPPKPPGACKFSFRTTAQFEEEIRNLSEILEKKNEEISQMNVDFAAVIKDTMDESNEKTADLKRKIRDLEAKISEKDGENDAELVIPGTSSDRVIIKNSGIFEIQNLKDRLEKQDRLIKHKDSQIESLQAEKSQTHYDFNEKMKEALQIADRDLDEANQKINNLQRKLEISTKEAEGFFSDLQKIAVGNTKTPSKGSQDVPDASGFMARKLKAENIGLKLDNDRLTAKIQNYDSQHTAEIKELNRKIDNFKNRLESEVSARLETKRELDHSFDQRVNDKKAYDKDLERHVEKIQILETRVKNAEAASFQCTEDGRNKEKLLTKQIKGLQAQVAAYGHMTAVQDKDATIWKLTMDLQAALMENDRLKSELSAKNAYGGDEELQKRIETLTDELEEKRAVIAQYDQKDSRLDEAFEEIQILRRANEQLSRKLSNLSDGHLQKRIESLTVELKKQKDAFDQAKARNYDTNLHLMAKIEELKANNGHQNDSGQSSQNQEEIAKFQAKFQGAAKEIERLKLANEELSLKMSNGRDEHLQERIDSLTVELNKQKSSIANLHESNRRLIAKLDVANARIKELAGNGLQNSVPPDDSTPVAALKLEISQFSEKLKYEKSKLASREAEIQNLTKINDTLEKETGNLLDENRRLRREIDDLKEEIQDSQCSTSSEVTSSESYEERLRCQAEIIKDLEEQLRREGPPSKMRKISSDGLLEENQRLLETIRSFKDAQTSSGEIFEKIPKLEKEVARLQAEKKKIIEDSDNDYLRLTEENSDLLDQIEFHVNQIRLKEKAFEAEKAKILEKLEYEQLKNQRLLEALNFENSKFEAEKSAILDEISRLHDENQNQKQEISRLLEALKIENSEFEADKSEILKEISRLQDENQRLEDLIQNQNPEVSRLLDENQRLLDRIQNQQQEISRLLEALNSENSKFEAEKAKILEENRKVLENWEAEQSEIFKEISRLQDEHQNEEISDLRAENRRLEDMIQNQQQDISHLQDLNQNQKRELERLLDPRKSGNSKFQAGKSESLEELSRLLEKNQKEEVSRLQDENQRHQDTIHNQRQEISRLLETLNSENSKFEDAESEALHARQLAVIQNQNEEISRLLEAQKIEKSRFEAEKAKILEKISRLQEALKTEKSEIVKEISRLQEENRRLEDLIQNQQQDVVRLQEENQRQKEDMIQNHNEEISRLLEAVNSKNVKFEAEKSEILATKAAELEAQHESHVTVIQDLILEKRFNLEAIKSQKESLKETSAKMARLQTENQNQLQEIQKLSNENSKLLDIQKETMKKTRLLKASEQNARPHDEERLPEISGQSPEAVRSLEKSPSAQKVEALNAEIALTKQSNFVLREKLVRTRYEVNRLMSELEIQKSLIDTNTTTEHQESLTFAWAQVKHLDVKLKKEKEKFDEIVSQKLELLAENAENEAHIEELKMMLDQAARFRADGMYRIRELEHYLNYGGAPHGYI